MFQQGMKEEQCHILIFICLCLYFGAGKSEGLIMKNRAKNRFLVDANPAHSKQQSKSAFNLIL